MTSSGVLDSTGSAAAMSMETRNDGDRSMHV